MAPPGRSGGDAPDPWADLRGAIDGIDEALLDLLNQRAALAGEVARRKKERGADLYVPARERAIIDRLQARNPGPFPTGAIRPVFQEVISACLRLEGGVRISYLGPEATFTHQAAIRKFGSSLNYSPLKTIGDVFFEVSKNRADYGVVPIRRHRP